MRIWYAVLPCFVRGTVCDTKSEQTTVFTCCCSEPCGTVCKRKLDCNTVRFKKFVMYHDCLMRVPAGPRSSERSAPAAPTPCRNACPTPWSDNSLFRRLRPIPSPLGRVSGLRSPLARRWTVHGRAVARPANDCQNHITHFHTEPLAPGLNILAGRSQRAKRKLKGSRRLAKP